MSWKDGNPAPGAIILCDGLNYCPNVDSKGVASFYLPNGEYSIHIEANGQTADKALFTDERFKSISAEAKILYGILLDRMSLSRKNGWLDEQGRVFIIFTLEEVMEAIGCADQKATKLLNELDSKAGLIERKRQGLGKPNLIFVKNFVDNSAGSIPPAPESRIRHP